MIPTPPALHFDDGADRRLVDQVRPSRWRNPAPADAYNLVVIGGGTAGLVAAVGAAGLGARVALIERDRLGGDCLNTGCVPSKALIRSARVIAELRRARSFGVTTSGVSADFPAVMERMRERRAAIAANDSAERLRRLGIDVFFGSGQFADDRTIVVDDQVLRFRRAVIATGGRPATPPIAGLDTVPFFTNETIFSLTAQPRRLLVVGAGPIGCELAQTFARFGSDVTVFDQADRILPNDDPEAGRLVRRRMEADGVRFVLGVTLERFTMRDSEIRAHYTGASGRDTAGVAGDALLVAAGRAPNVEGLGCAAARVAVDRNGVVVNDRLQTSNGRVFASGDVCSRFKFTHAADALSRVVLQNALFYGRRKASALVIPWVTYTSPEVAHVGVSAADVARSQGRLDTITVPLAEVDRAVIDDDEGFVRVHHERGRLRGCTVVAPQAGEIVAEAVYALTHGGGLGDLSATVHPYPTVAEALRKAGDAYRRQALTPRVRRWLLRYFALIR